MLVPFFDSRPQRLVLHEDGKTRVIEIGRLDRGSAVHRENLARDPGGKVGEQEEHSIRNILRDAATLGRLEGLEGHARAAERRLTTE